jgi:hypothetical protein
MTAPGTVVIGVIDDGLAFAHERFRKGAATRVEFWWLQDGTYWKGPSNLLYGRELAKADIDTLMQQCTSAGLVNEDEVYQRAGLNDFTFDSHKTAAWRLSHGTHVMDLACGFDSTKVGDDRPIVVVQLPARVTADTSGADLRPYAAEAIDYILSCADRIAQARGVAILPVVINLSYGTIGGPHDGTSSFERFIDRRVAQRKARGSTLDVVIPSGNSHLSRCHAEIAFANPGASADLPWRIQPDDQTPSFLDLWLPPRSAAGASRIKLSVQPPGGTMSPPIDEGSNALLEWRDASGNVYCQVHYTFFPPPTARGRFRIRTRPTATLDSSTHVAPAGVWTIRLENKSLAPREPVQAWIQRDESLYGHPLRGRQSYFDDPLYERYDDGGRPVEIDRTRSLVRRARLLNSLATGRDTVVVGGYVRESRTPCRYSAAGPASLPKGAQRPPRVGPDALIVSDDSLPHDGVLAAASRSGGAVAMNGTSVAAPQIARWLAEQRANGVTTRGVDLVQARAKADEQSNVLPGPPRPPPERGGTGRANLPPVNPLPRVWR